VFSYAAIACIGGEEELVGFVTARQVWMHECDPVVSQSVRVCHIVGSKSDDNHLREAHTCFAWQDRHHLGVWGPLHDMVSAVYILTLGVSEGWRQCGIASTLLQHVRQHALQLRYVS
jgi:ribosomal protein S18 acetylase RimI-like enzyme